MFFTNIIWMRSRRTSLTKTKCLLINWKYRKFCHINRFDFSTSLKSFCSFIKIENFEFAIFASEHDRENVSINFQLYYYFYSSFSDFLAFVDIFSEFFIVNHIDIKSWISHEKLKNLKNSWNDENVVFFFKKWTNC